VRVTASVGGHAISPAAAITTFLDRAWLEGTTGRPVDGTADLRVEELLGAAIEVSEVRDRGEVRDGGAARDAHATTDITLSTATAAMLNGEVRRPPRRCLQHRPLTVTTTPPVDMGPSDQPTERPDFEALWRLVHQRTGTAAADPARCAS
jgi:hypothetical protein